MSSFSVENGEILLWRDILTQDIFNTDMLVEKRHLHTGGCTPIEIKGCMKSDDAGNNAEEGFEEKKYESYGHHIFGFVEIPSCVTLVNGHLIEPLYFVLVKEKGIAELLGDGFDHIINIGDMFLRSNYLKLVRSCNSNMKQFQVIALCSITS